MYIDVIWTITSPILAFALGLAWRHLTRTIINRRAREFWRPFIKHNLSIIVGRQRLLFDFERSGLVGVGDLLAANSLASHLDKIGFRQYSIEYNDQLEQSNRLAGNLVVLGGPDANIVTRDIVARLSTGLEFAYLDRDGSGQLFTLAQALEDLASHDRSVRGAFARLRRTQPSWNTPVILDHIDRRIMIPSAKDSEPGKDFGVIIKTANPFNPSRDVLIVVGAYGHGVLGAILYAQSKEFLQQLPPLGRSFECVLEMDIIQDAPQNPRLRLLRSIQPVTEDRNRGTKAIPTPECRTPNTTSSAKEDHRYLRDWTT